MQYRRAFIPGGTFFFTVVTYQRRPIFDDKVNIQRLRQSFAEVMEKHPFVIDAIVVLPDHIHCIWTLPPGDADFSLRWRPIKGGFSRACPPANTEVLDEARRYKGERAVWQRRFWEHVIRDENDFERHVDYIHYNPVKHGFVKKPNEHQIGAAKCWVMLVRWQQERYVLFVLPGKRRNAGRSHREPKLQTNPTFNARPINRFHPPQR